MSKRRRLQVCNRAASWVSLMAFERQVTSRRSLQKLVYADLKARGLSAQPALHVIRKVADAYTTLRANIRDGNLGTNQSRRRMTGQAKPIAVRADAAQPFDDRCLSWQYEARTVSIWTVHGRLKELPFAGGARQLALLADYRQGETDLVHQNGAWFLVATCDVPEQPVFEPSGWLGIDLGIVNIATTSDGVRAAGRRLNRYRQRMREPRRKLQTKRTKSARRVLKRLRRKEARFATDTNHVLAKQYVTRRRTHPSWDRAGGPGRDPQQGTASKTATGRAGVLGVRSTRSVHHLQGPPLRGPCGQGGPAPYLPSMLRVWAHRQAQPAQPSRVLMSSVLLRRER